MQQEIDRIKQGIDQCKSKGDMMPPPTFDSKDISIKETLLKPIGTILFRRKYKIDLPDGGWINIEYNSKRGPLTALTAPHRSEVKVTCSDPEFDFSDSWEEKAV